MSGRIGRRSTRPVAPGLRIGGGREFASVRRISEIQQRRSGPFGGFAEGGGGRDSPSTTFGRHEPKMCAERAGGF